MDIKCPNCGEILVVDSALIAENGSKAECAVCHHKFIVHRPKASEKTDTKNPHSMKIKAPTRQTHMSRKYDDVDYRIQTGGLKFALIISLVLIFLGCAGGSVALLSLGKIPLFLCPLIFGCGLCYIVYFMYCAAMWKYEVINHLRQIRDSIDRQG